MGRLARAVAKARGATARVLCCASRTTGPGLAPEDRPRVGERGERLDESVPGSGLGLAIVRDISKLYGGGLELEQSPLGGLKAVLELPAIG